MSRASAEVTQICDDLAKHVQDEASAFDAGTPVHDMLIALDAVKMTMDILRDTKVGVIVNKIKKAAPTGSECNEKARELVERWKKLADLPAKKPEKKETAAEAPAKSKKSKADGSGFVPGGPYTEPKRRDDGSIIFSDHPEFRPNLSPKEVLQMGSFGGTYFRPIHSRVTGENYSGVWKELPPDWIAGLDIKTMVASPTYRKSLNKYKAECGGDLDMWENSGWITEIDPYGWFMWYCRFYQGRRCFDDVRQIGRGNGVMGATGTL
jgi:hypothetical protein